jgi:hypothetical protein
MHRIALVLLALTGCQLVFDGGDDEPCPPVAYDVAAPAQQLRNPQTGECQSFGNPYPCDDRCGYACPATGAAEAQPDWGTCFGECEEIMQRESSQAAQEAACVAHPACRAVYRELGSPEPEFFGCWATAPSGPVKGVCAGLDSQQCSRHDDCSAVYSQAIDSFPANEFLRCVAEDKTTPAACNTLSTEPQCTARLDCAPIYKGEDCTCTPTDCTCKILTYTRCDVK